MKIRYKLIVLLLIASVVPISVITVLLQLSTHRLSEHISQDIQDTQMRDTVEELRVHLHNYREAMVSASSSVLLAVKLQAMEAEMILAHNMPVDPIALEKGAFGLVFDIDEESVIKNTWHLSCQEKIDFKRQDVFLINTIKSQDKQDDLFRLHGMTRIYYDLYQANLGKTLWHYTSLENGIHTVYPGGGILPQKYDPRTRPWYMEAKNHPQAWAVTMSYDAATEALVLTVSMPIFRQDGSFAGVTAIDMPVDQIFKGLLLPSTLTGKVNTVLAGLGLPGEDIRHELRSFMQAQREQDKVLWQTDPELPVMISQDQQPYRAMMEDLMAGKAGIQMMDYEGEKSLWAYSHRIGEKASLHMIIPYKSVLDLGEQARQRVFDENKKQIKTAGLMLSAVILLTGLVAILCARYFTNPIHRLAEVASQLSQGNYVARADVTTGDELEQFANVFNDVGPKLKEHEKVQRNLVLAGAIQKNLLPHKAPLLSNFEIAGRCLYCDETGGDYFDFILPEQGQPWIGVVLGDVTGHGITAALLMASARSQLRNSSKFLGMDLVRLMKTFNEQLSEDTEDDKFMTLFYGILNDQDRSLIWASGGHDPAIWYHHNSNTFEELPNTGPLMGFGKEMAFEQAGPIFLQPNDLIVIGTDGIWEAQDSDKNAFGKDRLKKVIAAHANASPETIVTTIIDSVQSFTVPSKPQDDITLIIVKATGDK